MVLGGARLMVMAFGLLAYVSEGIEAVRKRRDRQQAARDLFDRLPSGR